MTVDTNRVQDLASRINDDVYRTKFTELPRIIEEWTQPYGGIAGRDVLDFGCGEGTTAIGMALTRGPRHVFGVEIQPEMDRCLPLAREQLGLETLPENLSLHRVEPGTLHDPSARFDVIYSWSVFEHVGRKYLADAFRLLRGSLKPGGVLFVQVAPLYYSAEGSHMLPWVQRPWGHLSMEDSEFREALRTGTRDAEEFRSLLETYTTLNKATADELVDHAKAAGLDILRDYRTHDEFIPEPDLLRIFDKQVLTTNQVVLLLR